MEECEHDFKFSHKEDGYTGFGSTAVISNPNGISVVVCRKCGEVRYNRIIRINN